ncbi:MAG: hypothetical protein HDT18_00035 [Oscillibacter sp.]|nr:hypothetical protein [Oscillibacter sp.]
MGTIAEKLRLLQESKKDIRAAIMEKGQSVPETAPLSSYGDKIRAIQTGADTSDATAAEGDILSGKGRMVCQLLGTTPEALKADAEKIVGGAGGGWSPSAPAAKPAQTKFPRLK